MCSDSTLLEPCQGVTWKVKGWVFWGQDTGTKREARWKLCFGRRKSNECMYYSGTTQYGGFLFFFFLNFIFYNFNFFFLRISWNFLWQVRNTSHWCRHSWGDWFSESPQKSKMKTTVLQIILEAPWPCTCNPFYLLFHKLWLNKLMWCFYWPVSSKWSNKKI